MVTEIKMADLGTATKEVRLLTWLKHEGDTVRRGETLCEVETDKATMDLESVAEGILLKQLSPADSMVEVGAVIAHVGAEGECASATQDVALQTGRETAPATEPRTKQQPFAAQAPLMVRNLAEREGVDLTAIVGTGAGGRITREDVLGAKRREQFTGEPDATAPSAISLSRNQIGVARTIARSWREIIPINVLAKINMTAAMRWRQNQRDANGKAPTYDAIFLHTVANAMQAMPRFQAYYQDDSQVISDTVSIGIAISVADDLYVPVVKEADRKSILQINGEIQDFTAKATAGRLTPNDMADATFTVSNLGMYPIDAFTAIIPPRQCGILTIGQIVNECRVENQVHTEQPTASVILSVDHRLINGRQAAEFLTRLKEDMENL